MATYVSYAPTTAIGRAMFNFDVYGITNFKLNGTVRVSVSDAFTVSDYLSPSYSNFNAGLYTTGSDEVIWTSDMIANVQAITGIYSQFANIPFQFQGNYDSIGAETTPNPEDVGRLNVSDINITWINRPDGSFAGISGISSDANFNYTGGAGDIFMNEVSSDFAGDYSFAENTRARQIFMHELGHSLGLAHPHTAFNNGVPTVSADYTATKDLGFWQLGFDTVTGRDMYKEYFSIMSYDDQQSFLPGTNELFHAHTPMILDVIALQQAYGEGPGTTGAGNDTIEAGNAGYRTYFDKGGIDTINLSTWYSGGAYLQMGVSITGAAHLVGVGMSLDDARTTINFGGDPAHLRWYYGEFENAVGASGGDVLVGNVLTNSISGLGGDDYIYGRPGNDSLNGGDGNDQLFGEDGDDALDGGFGFDTLDGGSGTDTVDYRFFNFPTRLDLFSGRVDFPPEWSAGGQFDTLVSIENAYTGGGDDLVIGDGNRNYLDAGPGNDSILAGNGSDRIVGGPGNDTLNGAGGIDSALFSGLRSAYSITRSGPSLNVSGLDGSDTLNQVDRLVFADQTLFVGGRIGSDLATMGSTNIIWRSDAGDTGLWLMGGGGRVGNSNLGIISGSWRLAASGDFNGDGASDFVWRSNVGDTGLWLMNNAGQRTGNVNLGNVPADWWIDSCGDFNGDGKDDLLWRNEAGDTGIWLMGPSGNRVGNVNLGNIGSNWHVAASADYNGDGKDDIIWASEAGEYGLWLMGPAGTRIGNVNLGLIPTNWSIQATGDFNHDGESDLLWRSETGDTGIWLMGPAGTRIGNVNLGNIPGNWRVSGTGDYNGDGTSDLFWRSNTGEDGIWLMSNGQRVGNVNIGNIPTNWHTWNHDFDLV